MSGVICDGRVPARVKGKVYRVAVTPEMLYRLETVALTKRQEAEMEVAELKMLRFSLGVTRMYKIRNEYIRGTAQVGRFGENTRGEIEVVWTCKGKGKGSFYIAQYPVRWTAQSALHFCPPWQTCSFRHQLGFSGKHSSDAAITRKD